jgi:geranylgeranyl reductase family protein
MEEVDLVVVGASFAGLACAAGASARGVRTIVLERKPDPGVKLHTTGILVKEVADAWELPPELLHKIHGVRLYSPSLRTLDLSSPGYYFCATDTPGLMRWFASRAESAGAELRLQTAFAAATRTRQWVELSNPVVRCRFLVGSDGPRSQVASKFGLDDNRDFLFGVEAEYENVYGIDPDRLHVFLDTELAPGYVGWIVPGASTVQVGLAVRHPRRANLNLFVKRLSNLFDFGNANVVGRRAGFIPCGGPLRRRHLESVMLLGDAAGMVSPLTAGGIHPALQLGRAAGVALAEHLLDAGPHPHRVLQAMLPSYFFKRCLRSAFDALPSNRLYELAFEAAPFRALAQTLFFHHRGLFSAAAWRDIALALAGRIRRTD